MLQGFMKDLVLLDFLCLAEQLKLSYFSPSHDSDVLSELLPTVTL